MEDIDTVSRNAMDTWIRRKPRLNVPLIVAIIVAFTSTVAAAEQSGQSAPSITPSPSPALLCAGGVGALVTRPTQTTTTCVVPLDHVLIETGMSTDRVSEPGTAYAFSSYPSAEIRVGTALRNVEVDLCTPTFFRSSGETATSDIGAGVKMIFSETSAWAWGASVSGTLPTGTNPAVAPHGLGSVNAGTATVNLNAEASLSPSFGFAATIGRQFDAAPTAGGGARRYGSLVPSLEFTAALHGGTTAFAEGWTQSDGEGPATGTHRWLDGGLLKDVHSLQYDLEYGFSNAISPAPGAGRIARRYLGFGISRLY